MEHLALIMSGNRRWARENKLKAAFLGYDTGVEAIRKSISFCIKNNITYLSLYMFSIENFKRPEEEKNYLFKLLAIVFEREIASLVKEEVCIRFVGDRSLFPEHVRVVIEKAEELTKNYNKLFLNLLFCYGARQEIVHATKILAQKVSAGILSVNDINEKTLQRELWLGDIPDPDLIVRTGSNKEIRLSNFMLFQSAYSELMFLDCYWPEINEERLQECLDSFNQARRNFGA